MVVPEEGFDIWSNFPLGETDGLFSESSRQIAILQPNHSPMGKTGVWRFLDAKKVINDTKWKLITKISEIHVTGWIIPACFRTWKL